MHHELRSRRAQRPGALLLAVALAGAAPASRPAAERITYERLDARVMAGSRLPDGPMTYLVTPAGHRFRVLGSQPILDGDGTKLGTLLSYVGDTRDPKAATARAVELIDAVGPELECGGETAVLVQARVGFDPRTRFQQNIAFHTAFELQEGRWTGLPKPPPRPDLPPTIGTGPLEVIDHPGFPFDGGGLAQAAQVAARWLAASDAGDAGRLRAEMSDGLASSVRSDETGWARLVASRARMEFNRGRREVYRLHTWEGEPSPRGSWMWVVYAVDVVGAGRGVEKVRLVKEAGRWRVRGYGIVFPKAKGDAVPSR